MRRTRFGVALAILLLLAVAPAAVPEEKEPAPLPAERYWLPGVDLDRFGEKTLTVEIYVPGRDVTAAIRVDPKTRKPTGVLSARFGEPQLRRLWRGLERSGNTNDLPVEKVEVPARLADRMVELAKRAAELQKLQQALQNDGTVLARDCVEAGLLTD